MARYNSQLQSAAAVANNTMFGWFGYVAFYARLRRVTVGVLNAGGAITSMQVAVGLNVTTGAVATPTNTVVNNMAPGGLGPVNKVFLVSAWTTPPTIAAQTSDAATIPFNDQLL